jgi:serum/glucocorticoid-regulated kinase 2
VLLDETGYLKITDFGMSKVLKKDEKALTFCGTPEYIGKLKLNINFLKNLI